MKNKITLVVITIFFVFCFVIFYKGLNNSNTYIPDIKEKRDLPVLVTKDFYSGKKINLNEIFVDSNFYIMNIWASWCLPCRKEHHILMDLNKNKLIKIIGINYKDNFHNAKNFIDEFGDPYDQILIDKNGTLAIELGAYGVPETFIINKEKKIIKRIVGPMNEKILNEIKLYFE